MKIKGAAVDVSHLGEFTHCDILNFFFFEEAGLSILLTGVSSFVHAGRVFLLS